MDINDLKPKEVGDRLRSDDFNTVLEAVKLATQAIQLENDIPGAISDSDMRIAVKQKGVSGLLGMSVADLVIYLSKNLPEDLTRSEFIYEKFAPGSTLPNPGREASLFLGAGTYSVPGGGASLVLTENFNVVSWDGEKWVKVLEIPIEVPEPDLSTVVAKTDIVNDITTGGAAKVASAETVKRINEDLNLMSVKTIGKNLINPADVVYGKRIGTSAQGSNIINFSGGIMTGYIKVEPGKTYARDFTTGNLILVETIGDTSPLRIVTGTTFTPSVGENYAVVTLSTTNDITVLDRAMIFDVSASSNTFEPYKETRTIKEGSLPSGLIKTADWNKITEVVKSKNLFDKTKIQVNKWVSVAGLGAITARVTSGYIPVDEGMSYIIGYLPVSSSRQVGGFAKEGDIAGLWYVDSKENTPIASFTVPTGLGIKYVVVNIALTLASATTYLDAIQIEKGTVVTPYAPYSEKLMIKEEVLPSTPTPIDSDFELKYSEAIRDLKATNEINEQRNLDRIRAIRSIKTPESGTVDFTINNNSGADLTDVLLAVYLHKGSQSGDLHERHIFLNNQSDDFSDVRFLDEGNKFLNFYCPSKGNYELIVDNRIKDFVWVDPDGQILMCDRVNIFKSNDNLDTVTLVKAGYMAGINRFGDIFYTATELGTQILYKSTKASGYTDEIPVLDTGFPTLFSPNSFKVTDTGTIFAGCYQDAFNALFWRSVDDGDAFTITLDQHLRQHSHSIVIDRTTVPNTVYVNIDGHISPSATTTQMACYKTVNNGLSWERLSLPFMTDYGVIYAGDDFTIGGGEGAVKGTPTIWKRDKLTGEVSIKVDTLQNTPKAFSNKNAILVSAGGHSYNGTPKLYRCVDKGETWREIFTGAFSNTEVMNYSWRYGSDEVARQPNGATETQNFITNNYAILAGTYNLRYFEGGDHYMGLYYVRVPLLKAGENTFKVGYGYASDDIQEEVFVRPDIPEFEMKLNEQTPYVFDNKANGYSVKDGVFDTLDGSRNGMFVPKKQRMSELGAVSGSKFNPVTPLIVKNKTVSFWLKMGSRELEVANVRPLFGGENFQINRAGRYLEIIANGEAYSPQKSMFPTNSERLYSFYTLVFKNASIDIYINGFLVASPSIVIGSHITTVLGDVGLSSIGKNDYMASFKVFNKEFTQHDVLKEYNGGLIF